MRNLKTIRDCIRYGASRFNEAGLVFGHGTETAIDEASYLALHAVHLPPDTHGFWLESRVTEHERDKMMQLFEERIKTRKPAAYLTREAWFAGLPFYVDERVIVPRSPMAELIEQQFSPWLEPARVHRILDLCTGSGCIAIASALAFPEARVDAVDLSQQALDVAKLNIEKHHVEDRVRLIQSDVFAALKGEQYDVIVSNPPYVGLSEWRNLPAEYLHEPKMALASGEDGMDVVATILQQAFYHLNEGGVLIVEVGASVPALERRFSQLPFTWIEFQRGGDGVFLLRKEELEC